MKAVIIATGSNPEMSALNERSPIPLLPVGDRPFIQHIVEALVERGITEFDFVLHHLPEKLEHLLGNGARWGSRFQFHLARDAARPYGIVKALRADESILLAHADRLPALPANLREQAGQFPAGAIYDASSGWTGWAWVAPDARAALSEDLDEAGLEALLRPAGESLAVEGLLELRSYEDVLATHAKLLARAVPGIPLSGHEVEPGVWISRNVTMHPTARVVAPVFIGENCRIEEGVELGPNAVLGHNCVLGPRCTAANSAIFPGSYIGEALELRDVIVDKNLLINARLGAAIPVADDFILGSLTEPQLRAGAGALGSRLLAILLLLFCWPILLLTALFLKLGRSGPVLHKIPFIKLPATPEKAQWRTLQRWSFLPAAGAPESRWASLLLRVLPGLLNVARGDLRFVGVPPRSREEIEALSHDWQTLYLHAKAGLITEADVQYGSQADEDERYSAEAFYSATASAGHDFRLAMGYLGGLVKPAGGSSPEARGWDAEPEA